jgi:hypothetical protein
MLLDLFVGVLDRENRVMIFFFLKEVRNATEAHTALMRGSLCTQNSTNATHENQPEKVA